MTLSELVQELPIFLELHPEYADAEVYVSTEDAGGLLQGVCGGIGGVIILTSDFAGFERSYQICKL